MMYRPPRSVLIELELVLIGSAPITPLMMFETMPTPRKSMKTAKNRTQKPALFVVTATAVASAAIDVDPLPRSRSLDSPQKAPSTTFLLAGLASGQADSRQAIRERGSLNADFYP